MHMWETKQITALCVATAELPAAGANVEVAKHDPDQVSAKTQERLQLMLGHCRTMTLSKC